MTRVICWVYLVLSIRGLPTVCKGDATQYECGAHGRFEYCIDGIPDCVVGCHCHPGYYFDTETKICEPNIKLTQNFRRLYPSEPTRITISSTSTTNPIITTTNILDDRADAIAKDADDLGDWLYNQFFKTIENQVINKTDEPMTRRSGGDSPQRVPKRKSRKLGKKSSKKKRKSKKGLRRKLLRITEDDSLFDSSSSSDEYSSSSSYSDSTSFETDSDDEHGHRKIIMINKKPSPPLPSFIFLPNVDTPFYPPIGIPPPSIIPMYPMVPVPPMAPIYSDTTKCKDKHEITTTAETTNSKTTNGKDTEYTTIPTEINTTPSEDTSPTEASSNAETETTPDTPSARSRNQKRYQRNEFLRKIREKMKRRNKVPMINRLVDQYQEPDFQTLDDNYLKEPLSYNEIKYKSDDMPKQDDVDFKYLSQLIHRIDLNKTKDITELYNGSIDNMSEFHKPIPNFRRSYPNTYVAPVTQQYPLKMEQEHRRHLPKADDSYYTSLGREIASLIRKVDSKGEREINIEVEQENRKNPKQTVFNENRYAPRSYWERSIRSLLINLHPKAYKSAYSRDSNEHLYNLENQVAAATTTSTLTLQELENVVSIIEKAQSQLQDKSYHVKNTSIKDITSRNNLNINLYPKENRRSNTVERYMTRTNTNNFNKSQAIPTMLRRNLFNKTNLKDWSLGVSTRNESEKALIAPIRSANEIKLEKLHGLLIQKHVSPLHQHVSKLVNLPERRAAIQKNMYLYQQVPMMVEHKNLNFHTNNSRYVYNKHYFPLPIYSKHISIYEKPSKPSYFHHELHHFDYFD